MKNDYKMKDYKLVVCGGTFDHFHKGHATFLRSVLSISEKVLLGITSDRYVIANKQSQLPIQPFAERKKQVESFLEKDHVSDRVTIAPIDTIFYPEAWETLPIEAIVVTRDTEKGATMINNDREQRGLAALPVVVTPIVLDDAGGKLSATNIREGKVNMEGVSYIQPSWFAHDLFLPEVEKQWFKEPFGKLYSSTDFLQGENPEQLIAVGDAVTRDCNNRHVGQKLSVVDFAIQRKPAFRTLGEIGFHGSERVFRAHNPASHITKSLIMAISDAIDTFAKDQQSIIVVKGEEDLSVIPLVLMLPLHCVVVYGQPNQGIVRLPVDSQTKEKAHFLLKHFIESTSK